MSNKELIKILSAIAFPVFIVLLYLWPVMWMLFVFALLGVAGYVLADMLLE